MDRRADIASLRGLSVFLVGMMGSGKSSVGTVLARRLQYRFFDTDILIERVAAETVAEIFRRSGEESFREIESRVLAELSSLTRSVIATGGGSVLKPLNWSHLHQGLVIWLDAPVKVLVERLREDSSRPLLRETDLEDRLSLLWEERRSLYAEADLRVPVDATDTSETIVARVIELVPGVLRPAPSERREN